VEIISGARSKISQTGTGIDNRRKRNNHMDADLQACQTAGIKPKNHRMKVEMRLAITAMITPVRS
jgi:hypothetical protein